MAANGRRRAVAATATEWAGAGDLAEDERTARITTVDGVPAHKPHA